MYFYKVLFSPCHRHAQAGQGLSLKRASDLARNVPEAGKGGQYPASYALRSIQLVTPDRYPDYRPTRPSVGSQTSLRTGYGSRGSSRDRR